MIESAEIVDWLSDPQDVLHLSLTTSRLYYLLLPRRFHTVTIRLNAEHINHAKFILTSPDIACHICKLVIDPDWYRDWKFWTNFPVRFPEEGPMAQLIEVVAPYLSAMHTFRWNGMDSPPESMWSAIRICCPQLKNIGTVIGNNWKWNPGDPLYKFNGLLGFSVKVSRRQLDWASDHNTTPSLELPNELLDMLLNRSPHLEELHLESASFGAYSAFDFSRIARDGHWEMLRSFRISGLPLESSSLSSFLNLHTTLVNLTIVRSHPHPPYEIVLLPAIKKASFSPASPPLPNLINYGGHYSSLAYLTNPSSIRTLDISSEIISFDADEISPSLFSHFTSLNSLSIWIHSVPVFESILFYCRALSTLDISCNNQPDIFWTFNEFFYPILDILCSSTSTEALQSLTIQMRHKQRYLRDIDEKVGTRPEAMTVFQRKPGLCCLKLIYTRNACYEPIQFGLGDLIMQEYTYEVIIGDPWRLAVHEIVIRSSGRRHNHFYVTVYPNNG